jgi:hypothetical protein
MREGRLNVSRNLLEKLFERDFKPKITSAKRFNAIITIPDSASFNVPLLRSFLWRWAEPKKSNSEKEKEEKKCKKTRFAQDFIMAADKICLNSIKIRFV